MTLGVVALLLFCALLVAAAAEDVARLRISNAFSVAVLLVGIFALAVDPGAGWWQHPVAFLVTLAFAMTVWGLGWIGGGDAKLFAAAAFSFDLAGLVRMIPAVLILGGILSLLVLLVRLFAPGRGKVPARDRKSLPYGVAIAIGVIGAAWMFPSLTVFADEADRRPADILMQQGWSRS